MFSLALFTLLWLLAFCNVCISFSWHWQPFCLLLWIIWAWTCVCYVKLSGFIERSSQREKRINGEERGGFWLRWMIACGYRDRFWICFGVVSLTKWSSFLLFMSFSEAYIFRIDMGRCVFLAWIILKGKVTFVWSSELLSLSCQCSQVWTSLLK